VGVLPFAFVPAQRTMPLALISLTGESKPAKIGDGANGGNSADAGERNR
jgi:hypothetical protein